MKGRVVLTESQQKLGPGRNALLLWTRKIIFYVCRENNDIIANIEPAVV